MKLPSAEGAFAVVMKAFEVFVSQVQEALEALIKYLKETFGI